MGHPSQTHLPAALDAAIAALGDAERRLRESAAKAAESGDYDALEVLTGWARSIQALVAQAAQVPEKGKPKSDPQPDRGRASRTRVANRSAKPGRTQVPAGESVYDRDSDMLVKTARSRKSRNNYEHRAPADVVFTVVECISSWRPNQKLLTGDQLLDSYAKKKGAVISYQVYAVLGWLTQLGLVRRHGRSGYSVPQPQTIVGDVQQAWNSLKGKQER